MVYWVTGLAGAGKTTVGVALYERLKKSNPATVLFDGDALRQAFDNDLGYSVEDRFKCAMRYSKLCNLLCQQGITVVCCTISMFDDVRKWNSDNIAEYLEVYVEVDYETLKKRNQKQLYSNNSNDVAGVNQQVQLPKKPHVIINNNGEISIEKHVETILAKRNNL